MAKWIVCLVFGVLCVIGGAFGTSGFDSSEISCGSEPMRRGAICEETRNGVTERMTYDEMVADEKANEKAFQTWGRWVLLGVGVLLLGGGIAGIIARKRKANHPQQNHPQQNYLPQDQWQQSGGFGPQGRGPGQR